MGFLGAGLILKASEKDPITGEQHHLVQGITTAAATWLSAAVGLACGGGLYFVATFATAMNLVLLRFGPRLTDMVGGNYVAESGLNLQGLGGEDFDKEKGLDYGAADETSPLTSEKDLTEHQKKMLSVRSTYSTRQRPTLM